MLAIKAENMHIIFLLKKNVKNNIIKTILKYLFIVVLESFKEWKIAIISVKQKCESIEGK